MIKCCLHSVKARQHILVPFCPSEFISAVNVLLFFQWILDHSVREEVCFHHSFTAEYLSGLTLFDRFYHCPPFTCFFPENITVLIHPNKMSCFKIVQSSILPTDMDKYLKQEKLPSKFMYILKKNWIFCC